MTDLSDETLRDVLAPGEQPTLKTIAKLSGFAVPTVSRALNDAPDIGARTKEQVRAIAERIGYRPNRTGLRLRTGKTNVIAVVLATDHDMMNTTARLISAIAAATRGTTYHMNVTPFFPDEDRMDPVRYLVETRSADGLILNQIEPEDPRVAYLMEKGVPFATHGRTVWRDRHPYFDFDNAVYGHVAIEALARRGRKRVLMIPPEMHQNYAQDFVRGAEQAAATHGITLIRRPEINSDLPATEVEGRIAAIFASADAPDGIASISTNSAIAACVGAESSGRVIGRDFDLVSKESLPLLRQFRPQMIVAHEDAARAGDFLCRALMQAIDRPELPPMQHLDVPAGF